MTVTINGEKYNQDKAHEIFKLGRESIRSHGITDEHGYINKALTCTELLTHVIGSLPATSDLVNER